MGTFVPSRTRTAKDEKRKVLIVCHHLKIFGRFKNLVASKTLSFIQRFGCETTLA